MDKRAEDIGILLKSRLYQLETGNCKMLSRGYCNCNLCLVDGLLSLLSEKDKEIEGLKEEIKGYKTSLSAELLSLERRDRIKAEERIKGLDKELKYFINLKEYYEHRSQDLQTRIKSLEEGIEEHKWEKWGYGEDMKEGRFYQVDDELDERLYNLLEKKGVSHGSSS